MSGSPRPNGEDEAIVVYESSDREGSTFSLSPEARRRLQKRFGEKLHFAPRIFIAFEGRADAQRFHGFLARQLISLLTGLGEEQAAQVAVEFRDPVTSLAL